MPRQACEGQQTLWESVLPFHRMVLGTDLRRSGLGGKRLCPLSYLTSLSLLFKMARGWRWGSGVEHLPGTHAASGLSLGFKQ